MTDLIKILQSDAESSDNNWAAAIDGAERDGDTEAQAMWETKREQCAGHYKDAIDGIENGDTQGALVSLERASALESEGGDNADAHHAIKAIKSTLSESTAT